MIPEASPPIASKPPRRSDVLTIAELILLTIGIALGLWLVSKDLTERPREVDAWVLGFVYVLGGISILGPPLLIWERRRRRRRWGPGRVLWFSQGMASWLLWPPVIYQRVIHGRGVGQDAMSGVCYFYGTPLMAIYVTVALLAGGWIRRGRRRRFAVRSWRERFGLVLGMLWACTGLYILFVIYSEDFLHQSTPSPAPAPSSSPSQGGPS